MKIHKLTLSDAEMVEAVQMFLATEGVNTPVRSVSKRYSFDDETEVILELKVKENSQLRPAPEPKEAEIPTLPTAESRVKDDV